MIAFIAAAATWLVLALCIAVVVGKCIALGETVPESDDEADWLDDVPVDCLGQDEIDARFRQIVSTRSTKEWTA